MREVSQTGDDSIFPQRRLRNSTARSCDDRRETIQTVTRLF